MFSLCAINDSLTHRFAVPPLPQAGEGCGQLIGNAQGLWSELAIFMPRPVAWAEIDRPFGPFVVVFIKRQSLRLYDAEV